MRDYLLWKSSMDWLTDIFKVSAAILASFGGATAIVLLFSNWLGKIWANRLMEKEKAAYARELEMLRSRFVQEAESYKVKLKKSEFLFEKEFAAASELVAFVRGILPPRYWQEMDWRDACDFIAMDLQKIAVRLNDYLARHGAALGKDVSDQIGKSIAIANEGKFDVHDMDVGEEANKAAGKLYRELRKAEETLLTQVRSQISI